MILFSLPFNPFNRPTVSLKFVPRDLWVGVYWKKEYTTYHCNYSVFICLIPMLPIIVRWSRLADLEEIYGPYEDENEDIEAPEPCEKLVDAARRYRSLFTEKG